jgi:hypothetical protein
MVLVVPDAALPSFNSLVLADHDIFRNFVE